MGNLDIAIASTIAVVAFATLAVVASPWWVGATAAAVWLLIAVYHWRRVKR